MVNPDANFYIAHVTAPSLASARDLADMALSKRLAACANLIPKVESRYWWDGKLCHAEEVLILFKTTNVRLEALRLQVIQAHPYDTPEFVAIPIAQGDAAYLSWIAASTIEAPSTATQATQRK